VQKGVDLTREAFAASVAFKNAPEKRQADAEVFIEHIWKLNHGFASAFKASVVAFEHRKDRYLFIATDFRSAKWHLPHADSANAQKEILWNGRGCHGLYA
jgi:hypothetical protein